MTKAPQFTDPVYRANHRRVYKQRGRAAEHQCVRCPAPAAHWAQVHGEDGSDPWADFVPLCHRCHVIYDRGGRPGHPMSAESRAKLSASKRGWNPSLETRSRMAAGARRRTDQRRDRWGRIYGETPSSVPPPGRLTEDKVREIRHLIAQGEMSLRAIARHCNVGHTAVTDIRDGKTWAWLT